jgi:tripeptidyl-peptidase-1
MSCSSAFSPTAIMRFSTFVSLATLVYASNALPTSNVVLEKIESSPPGWIVDQSANIDKDAMTITLKIHLVNQGMDAFHKLAMDVS